MVYSDVQNRPFRKTVSLRIFEREFMGFFDEFKIAFFSWERFADIDSLPANVEVYIFDLY